MPLPLGGSGLVTDRDGFEGMPSGNGAGAVAQGGWRPPYGGQNAPIRTYCLAIEGGSGVFHHNMW
jgi:hypothetical protein